MGKKAKFNEKLFEKLSSKVASERKRKSPKRNEPDKNFQEEIRLLKEKKNAEKLAAEAAEKQRLDKLKRNAEMFDRLSSKKPKTDDRKKKSKPEVNEDFLAELNKLKAKKIKRKTCFK